jgi:ABC-type nitrate/sulfonate/bicarbonate transport system substrate-binding protein
MSETRGQTYGRGYSDATDDAVGKLEMVLGQMEAYLAAHNKKAAPVLKILREALEDVQSTAKEVVAEVEALFEEDPGDSVKKDYVVIPVTETDTAENSTAGSDTPTGESDGTDSGTAAGGATST